MSTLDDVKIRFNVSALSIEERMGYAQKFNKYGLCSTCENFKYRKTVYGKEQIFCDAFLNNKSDFGKINPSSVDPINDCNDFYPINQMNLQDMQKIATILEIRKNPIGFLNEDENEIIFIPPKNNIKFDIDND